MNRQQISQNAGKFFTERVEYTKNITTDFLVDTIGGSVSGNYLITPFNTLSLNRPFDPNKKIALTTIPRRSTKHTIGNNVFKRREQIAKLGNLGWGKSSILNRDEIFPKKGLVPL